jgi:hypothetical protein
MTPNPVLINLAFAFGKDKSFETCIESLQYLARENKTLWHPSTDLAFMATPPYRGLPDLLGMNKPNNFLA